MQLAHSGFQHSQDCAAAVMPLLRCTAPKLGGREVIVWFQRLLARRVAYICYFAVQVQWART